MIVVGCVSALLFLALVAYAPQLRSEDDGGMHAMSRSAVGFAGLVELLRDRGVGVLASRDPHPDRQSEARLLVLTPSLESDPKALTHLGGADVELIILPKWQAARDPAHPGWVKRLGLLPSDSVTTRLLNQLDGGDHIERLSGLTSPQFRTTAAYFNAGADFPVGRIDSLQIIAGPDKGWLSVVESEPGHAVLIKQTGQQVFILSDPDLLNNHGLAQLASARGAVILIDVLRGGRLPVAFDLTLAGFSRGRSLLALAFEPPFLAATLCAIAAAGLMGLHAAARFGPPLRTPPVFALGKTALADNSAALIRLVRREHRMGGGYAALTRSVAARAVGAPHDLDDDQMDALLDRLGSLKGAAGVFSDLERRARDARDAAALMAAARKLYDWRLEMTHERR
jgi:hypothetical protein